MSEGIFAYISPMAPGRRSPTPSSATSALSKASRASATLGGIARLAIAQQIGLGEYAGQFDAERIVGNLYRGPR